MFTALPSTTAGRTLAQVVEHLSQHPHVHGLLAIGSTASGAVGPHSDIDLVVIVNDACADLQLALTTIDGRLADVLFVTCGQLDAWPAALGDRAWPAEQIGNWLRGGRILHDRQGRLAAAQARARTWVPGDLGDDATRYAIWFSLNYNLAQTRRMWASEDPVYRAAVELRLLYSLSDLWQAYFNLRGLPHRGEKEQIRYLSQADPAFLVLFQMCLSEHEPVRRLRLYSDAVRVVVAPVGSVWSDCDTGLLPWPASDGAFAMPGRVGDLWHDLFGEAPAM